MNKAAIIIEHEKVKAIGQRNRLENEADFQEKYREELNNLIKQKQAELKRYEAQYTSLTKVEGEQSLQIEMLQYARCEQITV